MPVQVEKVVFIVFFAGERARLKITKICETFGVNRYPFPEDSARQGLMKVEVIKSPISLLSKFSRLICANPTRETS